MPPQIQALLEDRQKLMIIGGALAGVLLLIVIVSFFMFSGGSKGGARELNREEMTLATVNSIGQAIEIQALMSQQGINIVRTDIEGGKARLDFERGATLDDKDRAMVTLVQSGLMDRNVGLEIFDKSDLTASREEKRIRLIRARNGELARLIRKMDPIRDATVFISMPEPSLFKRDEEPLSATVQVDLPVGARLRRDQIASILNLLVGSIENLKAENVALSDTNGNVYNSVLPLSIGLIDKLQERDRYMEDKVRKQLDHLVGKDKFVVTVSTFLREAPKAEMELTYNPRTSAVQKSSRFGENMATQQQGAELQGGPASSYVPEELEVDVVDGVGGETEHSRRNYNRSGQEVEYNTGKKQTSQDFMPGSVEDITVAVTIDNGALPEDYDLEEFRALIARTASPLVRPENVSILFQDGTTGQANTTTTTKTETAWYATMPWWLWAIGALVLLALIIAILKAATRPVTVQAVGGQNEEELNYLRELTQNQAQQIEASQRQTQQIIEQQQQQLQQLTTQQQQVASVAGIEELRQTLQALQQQPVAIEQTAGGGGEVLPDDLPEDTLQTEIKSWIETS
ncbi:MAG: hypothetical protein KC475_04855 [Cyanobacteria bacterium HKST-UBA03]|nr:hypothetical protein [Cyanobacteria bacterium HKST-UBA03]